MPQTPGQAARLAQAVSRRFLADKVVSVDDFLAERRQMWGEDEEA